MGGRCETCKWWDIPDDRDHVYTYEGAIPDTWRMCLRTEREWWGDPPEHDALMTAAGYEADGVVTAPNFGCVQWEAKGDD